jgi:hypothetical protein
MLYRVVCCESRGVRVLSARKKSVLKKSSFEVRDGDAGVMFSTRVREQL